MSSTQPLTTREFVAKEFDVQTSRASLYHTSKQLQTKLENSVRQFQPIPYTPLSTSVSSSSSSSSSKPTPTLKRPRSRCTSLIDSVPSTCHICKQKKSEDEIVVCSEFLHRFPKCRKLYCLVCLDEMQTRAQQLTCLETKKKEEKEEKEESDVIQWIPSHKLNMGKIHQKWPNWFKQQNRAYQQFLAQQRAMFRGKPSFIFQHYQTSKKRKKAKHSKTESDSEDTSDEEFTKENISKEKKEVSNTRKTKSKYQWKCPCCLQVCLCDVCQAPKGFTKNK